jgi:hypothetical protein
MEVSCVQANNAYSDDCKRCCGDDRADAGSEQCLHFWLAAPTGSAGCGGAFVRQLHACMRELRACVRELCACMWELRACMWELCAADVQIHADGRLPCALPTGGCDRISARGRLQYVFQLRRHGLPAGVSLGISRQFGALHDVPAGLHGRPGGCLHCLQSMHWLQYMQRFGDLRSTGSGLRILHGIANGCCPDAKRGRSVVAPSGLSTTGFCAADDIREDREARNRAGIEADPAA